VLAWPVLYAGWLSLHEVSLRQLRSGELPFAGLANYARLFGDDVFWLALRTPSSSWRLVALEVVIGLAIALVIDDERVALSRVTRVLLLVPWGVPPVVNGLLWSFVFNAQYGYLNRALLAVGRHPRAGQLAGRSNLGNGRRRHRVRLAHHAVSTSCSITPGCAASRADCYEAAGRRRRLRLAALLAHLAAACCARSSRSRSSCERPSRSWSFDEIFAITQGGPGNATWVAGWYTYRAAVPAAVQHRARLGLGRGVMALVLGAAALALRAADGRRLEALRRGRLSPLGASAAGLANLAALAFLLLPLAPVVLGALQSEKAIAGRRARAAAAAADARQLPAHPLRRHPARARSSSRSVTCRSRSSASRRRSSTAWSSPRGRAADARRRHRCRRTRSPASNLAWVKAVVSLSRRRLVPLVVLMVPLYVLFRRYGLLNSLGRIVVAEGRFLLPYAILILVRRTSPRCRRARGRLRASTAARASGRVRTGSCCRWPRRAGRRAATDHVHPARGTSCSSR
jgi:multiple sugar transport system permease protein